MGTSAGSLSPRTNWDSLASYEFPLPPLEEQRRIAEIFSVLNDFEEKALALTESLKIIRDSWIELNFSDLSSIWPEKAASEVLDRITVGIVVRPADLYVPKGQGVPSLRSLNVLPDRVILDDLVYISHEGHAAHVKSMLSPGDVVVVRSGRPGDAAVISNDAGKLNCIDLIICRPSPEITPDFLCSALNSRFGRKQIAAGIAGTAQQHLNVGTFKQLRLPIPPLGAQKVFIEQLRNLTHSLADSERRLLGVRQVKSILMERTFAQ